MFKKKSKSTSVTRTKAICLSIGELTLSKKNTLLSIREKYITVANDMTSHCFQSDFLNLTDYSPSVITKKYTLPFQTSIPKGFLNKTYIEKARKSVESTLWEQYLRSIKSLCFSIHNIDKENYWSTKQINQAKKKNEVLPKYQYIPLEMENNINENVLNEIKSAFSLIPSTQRLTWLRDIIFNHKTFNFNHIQIDIIHYVYTVIKSRFSQPRFGINDDFSTTIHLDSRIINQYKEKVIHVDQHYKWLIDNTNKHYRLFLAISHPVNHGEKINIPIQLNQALYQRLLNNGEYPNVQSLLLVIKHDRIEVRSTLTKENIETNLEAQFNQLKNSDHIVARDFGYVDTITLSVIENEFNLSFNEFKERLELTKSTTKLLYQDKEYSPKVIEQVQYSGKNFIEKLSQQGLKIDRYKSEIDCLYNKIELLLINIKHHLQLKEEDHINEKLIIKDEFVQQLINKFFKLLNITKHLKTLRRNVYKKIQGIKKSWFGFLSNVEKKLLTTYNATMIVEDLSVMAIEKEKPKYRGKSFNKMINNGSKGQYMRMAKEKFLWNGILEIRIPSFFSSTTCTKHKVVDKNMRKNKLFLCPICNIKKDADKNASDTIASFLLLS